VALLTAYSYVRLSLTYPSEGGTVTFLDRAFGRRRFAGGLNTLLVLSYVIIMALYAGAFANYAGALLPRFAHAIGQQALAPGIIVLLALVNLVGPALVEKSEGLFNAGKLGILLVFVVVGLSSPALTLERLDPSSWVLPVEVVGSGMLVFLSYSARDLGRGERGLSGRVRHGQRRQCEARPHDRKPEVGERARRAGVPRGAQRDDRADPRPAAAHARGVAHRRRRRRSVRL
jgi:hypothetical protein